MREIVIFTGSAHPGLAAEICAKLGEPLSPALLRRFANDCLQVQLQANCRERDVFIIQPLTPPVQEHLVELLLMLDAARGSSAARVTPVIPHYSYARSDKKEVPRVSIGARLIADLLVTAGANRVLTMAMHSPQVHGFFSVPVDHLHALAELAAHFRSPAPAEVTECGRSVPSSRTERAAGSAGERPAAPPVVVSPDLGYAKPAAAFARLLGLPVAAGAKQRFSDERVTITSIIGDIDDRHVIVIDDEIARGTTILELLDRLRDHRVRSVRIACTHGLFSDGALDRIAAAPEVTEIVCTNTVPLPQGLGNGKLRVLSVAPALAEAIRRIHLGESVSALFDHS